MGGLRIRSHGITSSTKIVANIFISFIGAGMLSLPYAFKEAGVVEGAVIMSVVGYLSTEAMLMLIDCKYAILAAGGRTGGRGITMEKKVPLLSPSDDSSDYDESSASGGVPALRSTDITYGDVGLYALGKTGKRLVDVAIVVSQIGFCCGYLIYLCKNLSVYAPVLSQHQWLLLLLPPLYCLTLLRHLNKLAVFSLFAQVSNVFALAVVFWFDFSHSEKVPFVPKEFSLKGMPFFFAVAIYCYEGAGLILSMEESVAESIRAKFRKIFVLMMILLTILYICFGVSGYLSFGPHTMDIITLNLPHTSGSLVDFAALVKVCLGVALFFTYPMMLFPVTHLLDKTCCLHSTLRGNLMRLVVVAVTGLVVVVVPDFGLLISLIGATCCTLLAFILPAAFHTTIFRGRLTRRQLYFNVLLVILGVLGSVVSLCDLANRMSNDAAVHRAELSNAAPPSLRTLQNISYFSTSALPLLHNSSHLSAATLPLHYTTAAGVAAPLPGPIQHLTLVDAVHRTPNTTLASTDSLFNNSLSEIIKGINNTKFVNHNEIADVGKADNVVASIDSRIKHLERLKEEIINLDKGDLLEKQKLPQLPPQSQLQQQKQQSSGQASIQQLPPQQQKQPVSKQLPQLPKQNILPQQSQQSQQSQQQPQSQQSQQQPQQKSQQQSLQLQQQKARLSDKDETKNVLLGVVSEDRTLLSNRTNLTRLQEATQPQVITGVEVGNGGVGDMSGAGGGGGAGDAGTDGGWTGAGVENVGGSDSGGDSAGGAVSGSGSGFRQPGGSVSAPTMQRRYSENMLNLTSLKPRNNS